MNKDQVLARFERREGKGGNSLLIQTKENSQVQQFQLHTNSPRILECVVSTTLRRRNQSLALSFILIFGVKVYFLRTFSSPLGYSAEVHLVNFEWAFEKKNVQKIVMETDVNNKAMRGFCER